MIIYHLIHVEYYEDDLAAVLDDRDFEVTKLDINILKAKDRNTSNARMFELYKTVRTF